MRAFLLGSMAAAAGLMLSGCVSTAASVITAPVRVAGKAVDWSTTSQSESDRNRGRKVRKQEEAYGKLERSYRRNSERCQRGDDEACEAARTDRAAMEDMRGGMPSYRDGDH